LGDNSFFLTLAVALGVAFIAAVVATRLRLSVILAYLVAGMLISPFTPGFVGDVQAVRGLADVGIVLLMFGIGLQFSPKGLLRVGPGAVAGATVQVIASIGLGVLAGWALGWGLLESAFLGAVVSNSSSTVMAKVLGERGETQSASSQLALAWSTVQDLTTVVLIVLLSALATAGPNLGEELLFAILRAGGFLIVVGPLGLRFAPWFFNRVGSVGSREVFLLGVIAFALVVGFTSTLFGLSLALGAFLAGLLLGESDLSYRALGEIASLRDLFAGLFFVSIGMLIDPPLALASAGAVLVVVLLIGPVKGAVSALLLRVFRYPARTAILGGAALAQGGEFSVLLARVGSDVGALDASRFAAILTGTAIAIAIATPVYDMGARFASWLSRRPGRAAVGSDQPAPESHVLICGYGRVGRMVAGALRRRGIAVAVIDEDSRNVREALDDGIPAWTGDAGNPTILDLAGAPKARVIVLAIPDSLAARQATAYCRSLPGRRSIVVRAADQDDARALQRLQADEAVVAKLELGLEMTRHALRRVGVTAMEALAIIQAMRAQWNDEEDGPAPPS
jgi:CPA2 family monovalent cation:H+ antiporter-2